MEKMLKTKFGWFIYLLGVNMFLFFLTVLRSYYEIPLLFGGIMIILSSQLIPHWISQLLANKIFVIDNMKGRAILWLLVYVLFFPVIWYAVTLFYPEKL